MSEAVMLQGLWGQCFYNSRQKMVVCTGGAGKVTMFEQFVLQPIWDVYAAVMSSDSDAVAKIIQVCVCVTV